LSVNQRLAPQFLQSVRRSFWSAIAVIAAIIPFGVLAPLGSAAAQSFPSQTVRIVVPTPPGSSVDIAARLISERLRERLGQPVIIENRPGAGGTIAGGEVARAAADGHTLFAGFNGPLASAPLLFSKMTYRPLESFVPIITTVSQPHVLVVNAQHPAKNLAEFVASVRSAPGRYNYASVGNGSASHLTMELLKSRANLAIVHIPYTGGPGATQALVAGDVHALFTAYVNVRPMVSAGRLRVLGIAESKRSPALPDVPTFAEQGFAGIDAPLFNAIVAPAGTPAAVVARLNREIGEILMLDDTRNKLASGGMDVIGGSPEQLAALMRAEAQRWQPVVERLGLRPD
jgi:tripartite-type tricarboxylate transporter receptor subunit TctC